MDPVVHERRVSPKPSIRETLRFSKEIPITWLLTGLAGGLVNFAVLVWLAASVVFNVDSLKESEKDIQATQVTITNILNAHAIELQKQFDADLAHTVKIDEHGRRIEVLERRRDR
jgi:hypothetical protein